MPHGLPIGIRSGASIHGKQGRIIPQNLPSAPARPQQAIASALFLHAQVLLRTGDDANRAWTELERALAIYRATVGEESPQSASVLGVQAGVLQRDGRTNEALATYRWALSIHRGRNPRLAGDTLYSMGVCMYEAGDDEGASLHFAQAADCLRGVLGDSHHVADAEAWAERCKRRLAAGAESPREPAPPKGGGPRAPTRVARLREPPTPIEYPGEGPHGPRVLYDEPPDGGDIVAVVE